jgi:DNA-binding GntR family transcriptional regulator
MLSDQVVALLYRELVSGRLRQGHQINEAQLARELGISRNPIREAVRRLEERGLLVSTPRRGTAVRTFTKGDIDDIFSLRVGLESFAIQQALPRMTPADHAGISSIVQAMVAAAAANNEMDLIENDIAFHRRLAELSGNRQTVRAFDNINGEMRLLIALIERHFESLHDAAIDHIPIVNALATGDVDLAVAAMREHIEESWQLTSASYSK